MINAVFFKDSNGLSGFSVSGHAGWGESGSDIVCAAVSSAAELTCNTITDFFADNADVSVEKNGTLSLKLKIGSESSRKMLDSFYTHIGLISEEFPGCIKISLK